MERKVQDEKRIMSEQKTTVTSRFSGRFAKEISLWALLARGSIYKITAVLIFMSAAELILFAGSLSRKIGPEQIADARFETIFDMDFQFLFFGGYAFLFFAALCLVAFILHRCETVNGGSMSNYTFERLRITRRHLFFVETVYNFLCFVLVFTVQIWTVLGMCQMYAHRVPALLASPQMIFLAFYRLPFLHNLLPLAETGKWVRNLLMLLAISMAAPDRGMKNYFHFLYPIVMIALWWNLSGIGAQLQDIFMGVLFALMILASLLQVWGIMGGDESVKEAE